MKKLVLLVGSLLAVSAVASAKEVVPKPKAAPEVQVKEVIKEVPVEKIVYQDKIVEVPKVGPKGTFEVSYKVPFYGFEFGKSLEDTKNSMRGFTEIPRVGTLETKAEVEVAPKHKVRAEAESSLELFPHKKTVSNKAEKDALDKNLKDANDAVAKVEEWLKGEDAAKPENAKAKTAAEESLVVLKEHQAEAKKAVDEFKAEEKTETVPASEASLNKMLVGYNYAHNDFVSIDTAFEVKANGEKSVKVAPTFDVKSYFFENDYVKAKEISVTPAYKYTWSHIPAKDGQSNHELSLSAAAKFEGPYATEVGLDLEDFVVAKGEYVAKADKPEETELKTVVKGNAAIYAKKGFGLYENGNHNVNLDVKAGYQLKDFAWSDNAKGKVEDKDVRLNTDKLYVKPALTYTYKINDYSKVYTTLDAEVAGVKSYRIKDAKRSWALGSNVKAGLKVEF